jgi:hypothetical protein
MSADGELVLEQRLAHTHESLYNLAREYSGSEDAIEATGSYPIAYEILDQEIHVTLVNPSRNRVLAGATMKTDSIDAKISPPCSGLISLQRVTFRLKISARLGISSERGSSSSRSVPPR